MKLAVIVRILGNENPPRDIVGERIKVLRHILENEPQPPEVLRFFILNRIVSDEYRKELQTLLESYQLPMAILPFNWKIKTTVESVALHGIAINQARNVAIGLGANVARYTVVLDGDCGFTEEGLSPVLEEMRQDSYKYLSIPHRRAGQEKQGEPMLAFRDDADLCFDETRAFGDMDKIELLIRLGHDPTPYSGHLQIEGDQTKLVGEVMHYSTGETDIEFDLKTRGKARQDSLEELTRKIKQRKVEILEQQRRLKYELAKREWEKKLQALPFNALMDTANETLLQ
jgi:hypothetical protein